MASRDERDEDGEVHSDDERRDFEDAGHRCTPSDDSLPLQRSRQRSRSPLSRARPLTTRDDSPDEHDRRHVDERRRTRRREEERGVGRESLFAEPYRRYADPDPLQLNRDVIRNLLQEKGEHAKRREKVRSVMDRLSSFPSADRMSAESWADNLKMHSEMEGLTKQEMKTVFMSKVKLPSFVSAHYANDRARRKDADVYKWLDRLVREYGQLPATKMQLVRNRVQEEGESAEVYVQEFKRLAQEADRHISTPSLIQMIEENIHPEYKEAYMMCGGVRSTTQDVIQTLAHAMSKPMANLRSKLNALVETPKSSREKRTATATSTTATLAMPASSTQTQGQGGSGSRRTGTGSGRDRARTQDERGTRESRGDGRTRSETKTTSATQRVECFRCGGQGHYSRNCPTQPSTPTATQTQAGSTTPSNSGQQVQNVTPRVQWPPAMYPFQQWMQQPGFFPPLPMAFPQFYGQMTAPAAAATNPAILPYSVEQPPTPAPDGRSNSKND